MADFQTQYKINSYKYKAPERRSSAFTHRDLHRDTAPLVFNEHRVTVHDCRPGFVQDFTDQHVWEAFLFTEGIRSVHSSAHAMRAKHIEEDVLKRDGMPATRSPDKLLIEVGNYGKAKGKFAYPRGMCVEGETGDIFVADTNNHRIQIFNSYGVLKQTFGNPGNKDGDFNEPTGVAVFPNGDIVVADRKNERVQVFTPKGKFKFSYGTVDPPFALAVDDDFNVIVGTTNRTIEIYRRVGKLVHRFDLGPPKGKPCTVWLGKHPTKEEIIVSDPAHHLIMFYTYQGKLLYKFQPKANGKGLACFNTGVHVDDAGLLLVADTLNHTINVYNERGVFIKQALGPTDEIGAMQSFAVGPEGHLVGTEFASNGTHCLKIFRYRVCECHRTKPGSSKKTSAK